MELEQLLNRLSSVESFCFDTETAATETGDALTIHSLQLIGVAFAFAPGNAVYLSVPEDYEEACKLLAHFKSIFENPAITKIGHNLKYDINVMRRYNIMVQGRLWDTMIAHYLYEPSAKHGLKELSREILDYQQIEIDELIGTGRDKLSMRDLDVLEVATYACEDADQTWRLKEKLELMLKERELENLFHELECPLIYVLADMEYTGINVDTDILYNLCNDTCDRLDLLSEEIYTLAGRDFNIKSPEQLREVLFFDIGLDPMGKTKSGNYSVAKKTLKKITHTHPIIPKILEYKELSSLVTSFLEPLPDKVHPVTGRVHSSFRQARASTGRIISKKPNLQAIPARSDIGKKVRSAFVPCDENHVIIAADYSQIELRLMAELSRDAVMLEAFKNNVDIHEATAKKIFTKNLVDVTDAEKKKQRSQAKQINFGLNYGMSAKGLAESIWDNTGEKIEEAEANEYMDRYFEEFEGVAKFHENAYQLAIINGCSQTMFGRRRYLPDIDSGLSSKRKKARRLAINSVVQGSAADIIKIAMVRLFHELKIRNLQSKILLTIHDELVLEVCKSELDIMVPLIRKTMEGAATLSIPLLVEIGIGNSWLEAH